VCVHFYVIQSGQNLSYYIPSNVSFVMSALPHEARFTFQVIHMARRRYSDDERASLLAMLDSEGYPDVKGALSKVAKYANMPASTLLLWWQGKRNPPPSELQNIKKIELADLFEQAARKYLEHGINTSVMDEVGGKDAITAAAIAADKMNLLRSQPTERIAVEHSGQISIDERRQRIQHLLNQDDSLRRFIGASSPDD
jgi:transposase-like protein